MGRGSGGASGCEAGWRRSTGALQRRWGRHGGGVEALTEVPTQEAVWQLEALETEEASMTRPCCSEEELRAGVSEHMQSKEESRKSHMATCLSAGCDTRRRLAGAAPGPCRAATSATPARATRAPTCPDTCHSQIRAVHEDARKARPFCFLNYWTWTKPPQGSFGRPK